MGDSRRASQLNGRCGVQARRPRAHLPEVHLGGVFRKDERRIELRPESTNPEHQPIEVELEEEAFEICGIAVGELIGDGFNGDGYETWSA